MAKEYISIDATTRHGGELLGAIRNLQNALDKMSELKEEMLRNVVDPTDYSDVATLFGLTVTGADSDHTIGLAAYNLLVGAVAAIDVTDVKNLIHRLG